MGTSRCKVTTSAARSVTATFNTVSPPPPTQCVVPKHKGEHRYRVISQNPKPGTHLRKGSEVALKVGT